MAQSAVFVRQSGQIERSDLSNHLYQIGRCRLYNLFTGLRGRPRRVTDSARRVQVLGHPAELYISRSAEMLTLLDKLGCKGRESFRLAHVDMLRIEVQHHRSLNQATVNAVLQLLRIRKGFKRDHAIPTRSNGQDIVIHAQFSHGDAHQIGISAVGIE